MKRFSVTWLTRYLLLIVLLYVLAFSLFLVPSCSSRKHKPLTQRESYLNMITAGVKEVSMAAEDTEHDRYSPVLPEIERTEAFVSVEAETVDRPDGAVFADERIGYSGIGYISELPEHTESAFTIPVNVPYSQHYALTICLGSDYGATGAVRINQTEVIPFSLDGSKTFTRVTFYGVFLEKGKNSIALDIGYGHLECDYLELINDESVESIDFEIQEDPCDPQASPAARKLYSFLYENWGSCMLTGQYVSDSANRELGIIYRLTGQLPAIRFSELGTDRDTSQVESAIDWSVYMHGVVGLMWQWKAPGSSSVFAKDSDFDLSEALKNVDIYELAGMTDEEIQDAVQEHILPEGSMDLIRDIDRIAGSLRKLADMDIPVLWRPLHEAGGEWFWWGAAGPEYYEQLWELLFERLTSYHQLHNLIWIWNAQSADYCVPNDTYDIASVDVYLHSDRNFGSRYEQFISLARITDGQKILAISECSALPDQKKMLIDQSVWSFFGMWYGEYIMNPDGSFSDLNYSSNDLYNLYNSDLAFNLNDFLSVYQ